MAEKQKTIGKPVSVKGNGLHTGVEVTLTFHPAPINTGIVFRRSDIENNPSIKAIVENVVDTSRGTAIEENGARIYTVEHVLAAVAGNGIDNIYIDLNGQETPILDGSARVFFDSIAEAGVVEQDAEKYIFTLKEKISYSDPERGIEIIAYPDDKLSLNVLIDYNSTFLVNQYALLNDVKDFRQEIACCRTFVFLHELEMLLKNNLIKGGDLSNAIVIIDREINQEELDRLATLFNKPKVQVKSQGVLNNVDLYFNNEPARHKLLDLYGDLVLAGCPVNAKIIAKKPGHFSNTEFAKLLKKVIKKERAKVVVPYYNPADTPILDVLQVRKLLPHRYPFLLVDKIIELEKLHIVGIKNVTFNENFFVGHFPDEPLMPGVLIVEAMAQVGGILVLHDVPDPENYATYFLRINNVRFRSKVVPGDTLILKLELIDPIRRGIANMKATAFVGDTVVAEAELMAQVAKIKN
jgi:UDP-3-O-[3-hydroxymyristoyl] N-acetylglucosamine deacetylase/3-hydroxyacyl-[acyl-carrier-protein] dehydratase